MSYQFFKRIEDGSNLAGVFNRVWGKLNVVRIMSAPSTFSVDDHDSHMRNLFYDTCLWEMYLHGIVKRLREWERILAGYECEFMSSWKYYAASKRMDSIREYGGEDGDYDEDGNVKTMVTDEELMAYSVMRDLYLDDWRDIVQETKPEDLAGLRSTLLVDAGLSISDILKECVGKEIPTYKRDAQGNMVRTGFADNVLDKISREDEAEELISFVTGVSLVVYAMIEDVKGMPRDDDNKDALSLLRHQAADLLNAGDFKSISGMIKDICDRFENIDQKKRQS